MPRKTFYPSVAAVTLTVSMTIACAVFAADAKTPQDIQKARHEHYEDLGAAFKAVRDNSRGTPDWAALEKATNEIAKATINQDQWFPKGSGPEAGKTRALPEIWTKPAEFAAAQKMFAERVPLLAASVKQRDTAALQAAFKEVGGSCKNCHDTFRAPEE